MARIGLFTANFALILLASPLLLLLLGNVVAIDHQSRSAAAAAAVDAEDDGTLARKQPCNFNEPTRTYNATELVLCMNELASAILERRNINSNRITDRAYQDSRQLSYPAYPDYSMFGGASSNNFDDNMLTSLLSGAVPLPSLSNLFSGFTRPGFSLFNALSSIARYDDLKCVPRILCEVASGSMPGSIGYRQGSGFQDFGQQNSLFSLLTAFGASGSSSPILTFGRAALLGYTNRGRPSMCYHEYPRCPQSQDQLISYLNNHNGGFFRFFSDNRVGSYGPQNYPYRPQQAPYRPYYREPNNEVEYRIVGSKNEYPTQQSYLKPEDDRTGTGKLSFSNSEFYDQKDSANFFPAKFVGKESSKLVFPKEDRQSYYQPNRVIKSLNGFSNFGVNENPRETLKKDRRFFPQEDNDNYNREQLDYDRRPRFELFGNRESLVYFPHDKIQEDSSKFVIPT